MFLSLISTLTDALAYGYENDSRQSETNRHQSDWVGFNPSITGSKTILCWGGTGNFPRYEFLTFAAQKYAKLFNITGILVKLVPSKPPNNHSVIYVVGLFDLTIYEGFWFE